MMKFKAQYCQMLGSYKTMTIQNAVTNTHTDTIA